MSVVLCPMFTNNCEYLKGLREAASEKGIHSYEQKLLDGQLMHCNSGRFENCGYYLDTHNHMRERQKEGDVLVTQ